MTSDWPTICMVVCDAAFGWTLSFPRDVSVILIGVVLGLLLYVIRRTTSDPHALRQILDDERRLRDLMRSAKADGDRERLARYRYIRTVVRGRRARAEFPAVCASLLVLSAIIPWGQRRLEYLPVRGSESIEFMARTPPAMIGQVAHLVPQKGMSSDAGWIRLVASDVEQGMPVGRVAWSLQFVPATKPVAIALRLGNFSMDHPVNVNGTHYEELVLHHQGLVTTEVSLPGYRPLGWIPPHLVPGLAGWAVLLMIATAMTFFGLRRATQLP